MAARGSEDALLRETIDEPPRDREGSDHAQSEQGPTGPFEIDATKVGQRIGRFLPIACIGKGGMGVVWSAYDPQLDRKVAIKLIVADLDRGGTHGEHAASRMLREARSLAKLADPNVVAVYDVGTQDDGLYIAMEFIDGDTLDRHLATRRPWREVLGLFVAAGRGLAAAHAAGLVHRDFKPSNVVVTPAGRVVVLDFGLARSPVAGTIEAAAASGLDPNATEGGAMLGTPAYMSPEQWRGLAIDARSDQFNFCVALWEALCRAHPFDRTSTITLAQSVTTGRLRTPPPDAQVPARLLAVVRRGLATEPDARWSTMDALLAALGATERRAGPLVGVAGVAAVGAIAWMSWPGAGASDDPCAATAERTAAVWNAERKEAARAAFAATDRAFASDAWARVEAALEAYTRAWGAAATDACIAAQRGSIGAEQAALQTACHGDALHRLDALVQRLGHAGARGVARATDAVADLPQLERCADFARLRAASPGPDDADAAEVRRQLAEIDAALDVADSDEIEALLPGLQAAAARVDADPPISGALGAEVLATRARVAWRGGDVEASLADLDRAAGLAMSAGRDELFADVAVALTVDLVLSEGSIDAAEAWWKIGRAAITRSGAGVLREVEALRVGSMLAVTRHELVRARALSAEAMSRARDELGDTHVVTLRAAGDDARVAMLQGDYTAGLATYDGLVDAARETYGAKHPTTIDLLTQQLTASIEAGRREGMAERAQAILRLRDDSDINLVWGTLNLGSALGAEGRWAEADAAFVDAHAVLRDLQGVEYRASGVSCERARLAFAAGHPDVAWTHAQQCERELRAWASTEGHGHEALALASGLVDVAQIAAVTDQHADARRLMAELEATFAHEAGDDDTYALAMIAAAQLALGTGDVAGAEAQSQRVLAWLEAHERTGKRTYFEALALGIDTARWTGDLAASGARGDLATRVLDDNPSAHPGARRRLLLSLATLASRRPEALAEAQRLGRIAPADPELDLRERLELLRDDGDAAARTAVRDEVRVRSPWLRRVADDVITSR